MVLFHRARVSLILAGIVLLSLPAEARGQTKDPSDSDCMACHEDKSLVRASGESLFVDLEALRRSTHGALEVRCVDCHTALRGITDFPHEEKIAPASCAGCHADVLGEFEGSVHARRQKKLAGRALTCSDCHNGHEVVSASRTDSAISPLHVQETCLRCHRTAAPETRGRDAGFVASYEESVHARALRRSGLSIAATCTSCHGSHRVKVVSDAVSPVARSHVSDTCGSCHGGILAEYEQSIHGIKSSEGVSESPVCTDCHGEHKVQSPTVPSSKVYTRNVPETCGRCHKDERLVQQFNLATRRIPTFESSFHGVALRFGELRVANCASCHGFHTILPHTDPRSKVHPENIPATCGECHPNAGTNWAKGKIHLAEPKIDNYGVYLVGTAYRAGIAGSMGVFLLFIFADLWGHYRRRRSG